MTAGPPIALIGCGGISAAQLAAYRDGGLQVVTLCDRTLAKARARRDEYFPAAVATDLLVDVWDDDRVRIVDIATHVSGRSELIRSALGAGKHVLSQKPFVLDLEEGQELIALARDRGLQLAVNQNGRWAPHHFEALELVGQGRIGEPTSADFALYWPHDQIFEHDPHFATMPDLVLYDFGIHWFDLLAQLMARAGTARSVYAVSAKRPGSRIPVDTIVSVLVEYERASATILFRASSPWAEQGSYRIEGTTGTLIHQGASLGGPTVRLYDDDAQATIDLSGDWWSAGMIGTMRELVAAVEQGRTASNSAESTLDGLRLCFAAMESARTGAPVDPRTVSGYPRT